MYGGEKGIFILLDCHYFFCLCIEQIVSLFNIVVSYCVYFFCYVFNFVFTDTLILALLDLLNNISSDVANAYLCFLNLCLCSFNKFFSSFLCYRRKSDTQHVCFLFRCKAKICCKNCFVYRHNHCLLPWLNNNLFRVWSGYICHLFYRSWCSIIIHFYSF